MTHYTKGTPSGLEAPPTACRRSVSGSVSLPSSGCFSPFPHGTGSLSVSKEYLAFEGGPPIFGQDFTCPALLDTSFTLPVRGCHPLWPIFPDRSGHAYGSAGPRSLATTGGVSVDILSSGYLDVSVPRVCPLKPMDSASKYLVQPDMNCRRQIISVCQVGCPIRRSTDRSLFSAPRGLSQSITSFIASCCQGIHQTPFSRLI